MPAQSRHSFRKQICPKSRKLGEHLGRALLKSRPKVASSSSSIVHSCTRPRISSVSIGIYQSTMSVTARRLARFATALPRTATTPAASCRLLRTATPSISSSARSKAVISSSRSSLTSRRSYAASAAAVKEAEDGAEAPKWPERVLPEITAKDIQRLSRQRNIGM
jgi:hypothetical protein